MRITSGTRLANYIIVIFFALYLCRFVLELGESLRVQKANMQNEHPVAVSTHGGADDDSGVPVVEQADDAPEPRA